MIRYIVICLLSCSASLYATKSVHDYLALADGYKEQNKPDKALLHYQRALELDPNNLHALSQAGILLHYDGDYEQALTCYSTLLNMLSPSASLMYCIAKAHEELGNFDATIKALEIGFKLDPNNPKTRNHLRTNYMRVANFEAIGTQWPFMTTPWRNCDVEGKTILLRFARAGGFGLGDIIMQIRHAQTLKKAGARVIVEVGATLAPLLSLCPYIDYLAVEGTTVPAYDAHYIIDREAECYFAQKALRTPDATPYIYADTKLEQQWRTTLEHDTTFRIGICWQCRPLRGVFGNYVTDKRALPLTAFGPIARLEGVTLYSLQKINGTEQLHDVPFTVHSFGDELDAVHGAFMDTAAIMKNLDLIITTDTSIAHLAGALGCPVWVALPKSADWRWFTNRTDSPWYPTMRLFRQDTVNSWDLVIQKMVTQLQAILAG